MFRPQASTFRKHRNADQLIITKIKKQVVVAQVFILSDSLYLGGIMATTIQLSHPSAGTSKTGLYGFSWTSFFSGGSQLCFAVMWG